MGIRCEEPTIYKGRKEIMHPTRKATREDLREGTLSVLREFDEWFLPATVRDMGREFIIFLKWLDERGYVITKEEYQS